MPLLKVKISQNGSSREYFFNQNGPIIVGSGHDCHLQLEDTSLESRLLEIKVNEKNILLKSLGKKNLLTLNTAIFPHDQDVPYLHGDSIGVLNSTYQILIHYEDLDSHNLESPTPPPFFENEFQERLERMNQKIGEKENELKELLIAEKEKNESMAHLRRQKESLLVEKHENLLELNSLKKKLSEAQGEIEKNKKINADEKEKILHFEAVRKDLENKETNLRNQISSREMALHLLDEKKDKANEEINRQNELLTQVSQEISSTKEILFHLKNECGTKQNEIKKGNEQLKVLLENAQSLALENKKNQILLEKSLQNKLNLETHACKISAHMAQLENEKMTIIQATRALEDTFAKEEKRINSIVDSICEKKQIEESLQTKNNELYHEINRAEEKLFSKKNQINLLSAKNQDLARELSTLNFEIEQSKSKLQSMRAEENSYQFKIKTISDNFVSFKEKTSLQEKEISAKWEETLRSLEQKHSTLLSAIESERITETHKKAEIEALLLKIEGLNTMYSNARKEQTQIESEINEILLKKKSLQITNDNLIKEIEQTQKKKLEAEENLSRLKLKLVESESKMNEIKNNAYLEIENHKREELKKIAAEKSLFLLEQESYKQKMLIVAEKEVNQKHNTLFQIETEAQKKANEILQNARKMELEITDEATQRLKKATVEAEAREALSHKQISEGLLLFKQKEIAADMELKKELALKKEKIKYTLLSKEKSGLKHLERLQELARLKIKKNEEFSFRKCEISKRKELKKIAKIREIELAKQHELKKSSMEKLKLERNLALENINKLKIIQEKELANKKKSVIDHINALKIDSQKEWEEELKREKEAFYLSKKSRLSNATQAIMNLLIAENSHFQGPEKENAFKEKVYSTLEMTIDGQNASAMSEMRQILDFNPEKQKNIIAVTKKHALHFGVPAALIILIAFDLGSFRSYSINAIKEITQARHSASQIYADQQKNEWKEKHFFNPPKTPGYKKSFTENVIYTLDFDTIVENEEFQNAWILKLNDFMTKDLELSEDIAINYISAEGALVKDLSSAAKELHPKFLEQGIQKMRDKEEASMGWLKTKINSPDQWEKFSNFRQNFYDTFYENKLKNNGRTMASEKK